MGVSRPWTIREHNQFKELAKSGVVAKQIASELGRSYSAVYRRCRRYGIVVRPRVVLSKPTKPPLFATLLIKKSEVPDYYERGWRFVGFEGELCRFTKETRHADE